MSSDHFHDPIGAALESLRERFVADHDGEVASYIPELARVDPEPFGLALVSAGGGSYSAGDDRTRFTLQSISKPFTYALALCDHGLEAVLDRVGAEPSGEAYNAISLDEETGRPDNPMINAGAILTCSLVDGRDADTRFGRVLELLSAFAGRDLEVDESVFDSEATTGHRNRALAHLMFHAEALVGDVDDALEVYTRQCALSVDVRDVATMAATLSNAGTNPVTGDRVVAPEVAEQVMSVMATCGMYDASGEWLLRVGLPAKSGVGGGIVAVSPGRFGIATFSPRLDEQGNSVRGAAALRAMSTELGLHLLHRTHHLEEELAAGTVDDRAGALVVRLSGELEFTDAERVLRSLVSGPTPDRPVVLDLDDVRGCDEVASRVLRATATTLQRDGVEVGVVDSHDRNLLGEGFEDHVDMATACGSFDRSTPGA